MKYNKQGWHEAISKSVVWCDVFFFSPLPFSLSVYRHVFVLPISPPLSFCLSLSVCQTLFQWDGHPCLPLLFEDWRINEILSAQIISHTTEKENFFHMHRYVAWRYLRWGCADLFKRSLKCEKRKKNTIFKHQCGKDLFNCPHKSDVWVKVRSGVNRLKKRKWT